jgi:hypothetical protein
VDGAKGRANLVELGVECRKVDEVEVFGPLETRHAVAQGQCVRAHAVAGVSIWQRGWGRSPERLQSIFRGKTLEARV